MGPAGYAASAQAISANGKVIVGAVGARDPVDGRTIYTAFQRTTESGIQTLGFTEANGVFSDGGVVVGSLRSTGGLGRSTTKPYAWRNGAGRVLAETNYSGVATAVSGDGRVIAGYGRNPRDLREAWRAVLKAAPREHIVNSTADRSRNPGAESCDTGEVLENGEPECTLRAALEAANAGCPRKSLSRYPTQLRRWSLRRQRWCTLN